MPNVLCLCGYTQSAAVFSARLAAIRKASSANTTFKFLDPPHIVHPVNLPEGALVQYDSTAKGDDDSQEDAPRAWWFAKDVAGQPGLKQYVGLEETWALLKATLESERFDVVLGFSQGAALAGALASRLHMPDCDITHPPFKLAICVSGFAMQDPEGRLFPSGKAQSPAKTLHIIGRGDTIVSSERSASLVERFENPRVEYHDGGHYTPSKANFRKFFKAIFDSVSDENPDAWRRVPAPSTASASGTSTPMSVEGDGEVRRETTACGKL